MKVRVFSVCGLFILVTMLCSGAFGDVGELFYGRDGREVKRFKEVK